MQGTHASPGGDGAGVAGAAEDTRGAAGVRRGARQSAVHSVGPHHAGCRSRCGTVCQVRGDGASPPLALLSGVARDAPCWLGSDVLRQRCTPSGKKFMALRQKLAVRDALKQVRPSAAAVPPRCWRSLKLTASSMSRTLCRPSTTRAFRPVRLLRVRAEPGCLCPHSGPRAHPTETSCSAASPAGWWP